MPRNPDQVKDYADDTFDEDIAIVFGHIDTGEDELLATQALERIILSYVPTVHKVAQKFDGVVSASTLEHDDFAQSGFEGIYDGLARIDTSQPPIAFHGYNKLRVFNAMFRLSADMAGAVCLSEGALKRVVKARRINRGLEEGRELAELLAEEDIPEHLYRKYLQNHKLSNAVSLSSLTNANEADTSASSRDDLLSADPSRLHEIPLEEAMFERALAALPERRRMVIGYLFGVEGYEKVTSIVLAEMMGVTASRISQIRQETLQMLNDIMVHKLDYFGDHDAESCGAKCCEPRKTKRKPPYNLED